ncbi:MAG: hypothetical protein LW808_000380 [Verrucomicrobiota bacterium]|nr:MAG: hypothetical protein LW808_000380 [Verrucomicrobiota bacterium]
MEGKSYIWITKGLLCTVLWAASGVSGKASVLEMPPDVMPMSDESAFQGMELTIAPEKSGFDAAETRVENSSSIRGELGMTHAKLCDVFSRYGSLINSQWQSRQALEELENINNFLDLALIPEKQSGEICSNPQLFLDGIAPFCGGIAYCLEITNGSAISSSMYPNFFKTLYRSNENPVHAGRWSTNDNKVIKKMSSLFAGRAPIRREEVDSLLKNGELKNPSGVILYVIDRAADKVYMAANAPVHGKFENVFTKNKFGAWTQQSARWRHRGRGVKQATTAVASTAADVGAGTIKLGATGARLGAAYAPGAFNLVKSVAENTPKYKEKIDTAVEYVNKAANAVNSVANGTSGTAKFFSWMPFSKSITETLGSASSVLKPVGENIEQFGGKLASASENLTWVSDKVAPVIDKLAPTLGPVLAALKIARLVGLFEFAQKMPKVLYPSGDSDLEKLLIVHAKTAIALSGVKAKELSRDSNQMGRAAWVSDRVHLYDAAITLTEDWKQGFAQYPQEAAAQLAIGTARNVCCLVVTSGRFMCPNFFQKLYSFQYDPDYGRVIPEVTRANGIYDRKVCSILGEKCPIDTLLNTDTLLYIIDDASKEVYQVVYNNDFALPPQFPNIFNAQSWENWEGAIAPTTGWRFRKAMRLLGATSKNAFRKNVPIVGKMLIPQEIKGTPELTIPVAVGQLGMGDPLAKTIVEMPVSNAAIQQAHSTSGSLGYGSSGIRSFKRRAMQRDQRKQQPQSILSSDDRYDAALVDHSDPEFVEEAPSGMSYDGAMELEVPAIRTSVPVQQVRRDQIVPTKNTPLKVGIRKMSNHPGSRQRHSGDRPTMMRSKGYSNEGIFLGSSKFRQDYQPHPHLQRTIHTRRNLQQNS